MRVPIFPTDLAPKSGLKRLAKALMRRWCGASPMSLSFARELLSKGLGYRDYHELYQASKMAKRAEKTPSVLAVRKGILSAIQATLNPKEWLALDHEKLELVIATLPVNVLTAFKSPLAPRSQLGRVEQVKRIYGHLSGFRAPNTPLLTTEQLFQIGRSVIASGNFRDQALLTCLMSGLRPAEFLPTRVNQVLVSGFGETMIKFHRHKTSEKNLASVAIIIEPDSIHRHIRAANLLQDDYLFSPDGNPKSPMTAEDLLEICASWARIAGIEANVVIPPRIRSSALRYQFIARTKKQTGHCTETSTLAYLKSHYINHPQN